MVCRPDARIRRDQQEGYFVSDTRLISGFELSLSDAPPVLLNSSAIQPFSCRYEFTNDSLATEEGTIERACLHLRLDRTISQGVHEDYVLTNYSPRRVSFQLQVRVESDFADLFEVKEGRLVRRGAVRSSWNEDAGCLKTCYENAGFSRSLCLQVARNDSEPSFADGRFVFPVELAAFASWHTCLLWLPVLESGELSSAVEACHALVRGNETQRREREEWAKRVTSITTEVAPFDAVVTRAVHDLASMRIHRHDADAAGGAADDLDSWVPAAGIPWFASLFGRDILVVALQTMVLSPRIGLAALRALAALQGDCYDDARDVQPGKIEHEWRHGELACTGRIPQSPYYGTHDATTLFVWVVGEFWAWTADREAVESLLPHVNRALSWIDKDGDPDGDGLQEYATRAGERGYYNQGWKDSEAAIVNADGSRAMLPIALCELQGYVVAAKRSWARVLEEAFDDRAGAGRLRDQADRLAALIEERFWWEEEGTYYLGLDANKRPIESVSSNPGHLLWAGAVEPERAVAVAERLMAADMWTGWGVRTLSSRHVAYNPFSYQRGSVWPHDNAILAAGFRRYGEEKSAWAVAHGLLDAAAHFRSDRLPEVFSGLERDDANFPSQFIGANVPQAWASGAVIHLFATLLGAQPEAFLRRLTVSPALPDWLEEMRFANLRVGDANIDLRVRHEGCRWKVDGELEVLARPSTSADAGNEQLREPPGVRDE